MKATAMITPAICFAIGTACGIFFSGRKDTAEADSKHEQAAKNRATLGSSLGSKKSGDSSETNKATSARSSIHSAQLEQLLEFANGGTSASDTVELFKLTENLSSDELIQLAGEIEKLPQNDRRRHQLRNTVLGSLARKDPEAALAFASSIANRMARQYGLTAVINEIARTDLDKAIGALGNIKHAATLTGLTQALAKSGAEGAPAAIHRYLNAHPELKLQGYEHNQMFAQWAREDLPSALTGFGELTSDQRRAYALRGIGQSIDAENIDAGFAFLETLPKSDRLDLLGPMFGNLSATDPLKALALLDTHVTSTQRSRVVSRIAGRWLYNDPEAAKSWIESLEKPHERMAALQTAMQNDIGQTEWIAAQLASLPKNQQTQQLASELAQRWGQTDPAAAAAWTDQLPPGRVRDETRVNLMRRWAHTDPTAAGEYLISSLDDGPLSSSEASSAGEIAAGLVEKDPQAAITWIDSLDAGQQAKSTMISNMVEGWTYADPDAAAAYVMELEGKDREQGMIILMGNWNSGFESAETFASQIDDPKLRQSALSTLISASAYGNPEQAAATLKKITAGLNETELKEHFASATANIANGWAQSDPVAAATWAVGLPEGSDRPQALQTIAQQWAQFEPKAASEWLTTFEPGPDRDGAVSGLVSQLSSSDPESAFVWAASIEDESKRGHSVRAAINRWQQADQNAARAAIEASDFSDEFRNQLLQDFPKTN